MIKMTMLLKRAAGVTREEFIDHHVRVHGALMRSIPEGREHILRYVQTHPIAASFASVEQAGFDGTAELWFIVIGALDAVIGDATTEATALTPIPPTKDSFGTLPRGINHVGLTVPDLEAATEFLRRAFDARIAYDGLTAEDPPRGGETTEQQLGLPAGASIRRQRMLQIGIGPGIEMFEVQTDAQQPPAGLSDLGLHHVSVYVDDIDTALQRAVAAGAQALSEPHENSAHEDTAGNASVYVRAPWGGLFELQAIPGGHWYDATSESRVWTPPAR